MKRFVISSATALSAAVFAFTGTARADDPPPDTSTTTTTTTTTDSQTNQQPPSTPTTPPPSTVVVEPPPPTVVQPTVVQTTPPPVTSDTTTRTEYAGPNKAMIGTGFALLGGTYLASAIVAGTSQHPGDEHLYIPVAGPWIDLANRGDCGAGFARSCDNENTNNALLIGGGILQGVGVLTMIGGFLSPETREVRTVTTTAKAQVYKPTLTLTPVQYRGGGGIGAFGTF